MNKTLPILCVFIFNAFAQCAKTEGNLYFVPDQAAFFPQSAVECVVSDKPDYFPQLSLENSFAVAATADQRNNAGFSGVYAAISECHTAMCKNILALHSGRNLAIRQFPPIAHANTPPVRSSEDDFLIS